MTLRRSLTLAASLALCLGATASCKPRGGVSETSSDTAAAGEGDAAAYDAYLDALAGYASDSDRDTAVLTTVARLDTAGGGGLGTEAGTETGLALADDAAERLRAEIRAIEERAAERKKEAERQVKEAEERLRRARNRGNSCVLTEDGSEAQGYCACEAEVEGSPKKALGWSWLPTSKTVDLGYFSSSERLEGFDLDSSRILESKTQASACEAATGALKKRGLEAKRGIAAGTITPECKCQTVTAEELKARGADPEALAYMPIEARGSEAGDKIVQGTDPITTLVCEQRFRVVDTVRTAVENPQAFTRYFFNTATSFVTGAVKPQIGVGNLAGAGCADLNWQTWNEAGKNYLPRWQMACQDYATRAAVFAENSEVRCEGQRPTDILSNDSNVPREGCGCYLTDRALTQKMRDNFQIPRLRALVDELKRVADIVRDNQALKAKLADLENQIATASGASARAGEATPAGTTPTGVRALATIEGDPAADEFQRLQDSLNALSGILQKSTDFSTASLTAHIAGLTTMHAFSTLHTGPVYERIPPFAARWVYVATDGDIVGDIGLDFRIPLWFTWWQPKCNLGWSMNDCKFVGHAISNSLLATPTQINAATARGIIRFIPRMSTFHAFDGQPPVWNPAMARAGYHWQASPFGELVGEWKKAPNQTAPMTTLITADSPADQALVGDEVFDAESRQRLLQAEPPASLGLSPELRSSAYRSCACAGLTKDPIIPTNYPTEACLQFPKGHPYRKIHSGWVCDEQAQQFTCKGKAPVAFQCRARAADEPVATKKPCDFEAGFYCQCTGHCNGAGAERRFWLRGKGPRAECESFPVARVNERISRGSVENLRVCDAGGRPSSFANVTCKAYKWWDDPQAGVAINSVVPFGKTYHDWEQQCSQ
jgi:hypothetical protein